MPEASEVHEKTQQPGAGEESSWQEEGEVSPEEDESGHGGASAARTRKQKSDRIARLTFDDLKPYFNMPLYEAAARLKLCGTVLKRVSRRCGIPTWPFRQVCLLLRFLPSFAHRDSRGIINGHDPPLLSDTRLELTD